MLFQIYAHFIGFDLIYMFYEDAPIRGAFHGGPQKVKITIIKIEIEIKTILPKAR